MVQPSVDIGMLGRRAFLFAALSASASAAPGAFAAGTASDLVLRRPAIENADPRYQRFATQGPYAATETPAFVKLPDGGPRLLIHHPRNAPTGRLIVFSHGALAEPQVYDVLLSHWASHGFVVVSPLHDDSVISRGQLVRKRDASGHVTWEFQKLLNDPEAWQQRVEECRTVLDAVPILSKTLDLEIDASRPLIVGHDYGAYTAQILMGAVVNTPAGERSFLDDRFFSGLLLSPQGVGIMGLSEASWSSITKPLMVTGGGEHRDATGQEPDRKADPFRLSAAGNKHLAWWKAGTHSMYTGQRARSDSKERLLFEDVKAVTTAFLVAYGFYDQEAFEVVSGDLFERVSSRRLAMFYR